MDLDQAKHILWVISDLKPNAKEKAMLLARYPGEQCETFEGLVAKAQAIAGQVAPKPEPKPQPALSPPPPSPPGTPDARDDRGDDAPRRGPGRPRKPKPERQPPAAGQVVIFPGAPFDVAKTYIDAEHVSANLRTLHHHRTEFFIWFGSAYEAIDVETAKAKLYPWLAKCWHYDSSEELIPVLPCPTMVGAVLESLRAAAQVDNRRDAPFWLADDRCDPAELIACRNGLLHWPSGTLMQATPALFTLNAVNFDYDPAASPPANWLQFLDQIWPGDPESIDALQEVFGYLLTDDTSQQKIFYLKGPKRSGKGTIARVLAGLVGQRNTAAPTLSSLGTEFGLQGLLHKRVGIIGDARIGPKTDVAAITERLLNISGEDMVQVGRKYLPVWNGTLSIRFLIISNELPRFNDPSGALASRFEILILKQSFFGREDHGLIGRLLPELPGILNWAIDGLKRLRNRGHFKTPTASGEARDDLERLTSPILSFLRDNYMQCPVNDLPSVRVDDFCRAFRAWSAANGHEFAGSNAIIGGMLKDAAAGVERVQLRTGPLGIDGNRTREAWYKGIRPI